EQVRAADRGKYLDVIVLSLDTSTREGSAALVLDDRVVVEHPGNRARSHAERLPAALLEVLREGGVDIGAVDVFAVAAGPSSFTGLRIGIATIQGLAFVTRRPVVAVSVLEALAHAAAVRRALPPGTIVAAWMDAFRRDVFSALYRVGDGPSFTDAAL